MRRNLWLGVLATTLLMAVGGVTVASASSDITTATTIHFLARQTSFTFIDVGKKGFSFGDYYVATEDLLQAGKKIGHDAYKCTAVSDRDTVCEATYVLAGGQITTQGDVLPPAEHFNVAVTGGTGIYQNVRGQLTIVPGPRGADETFHLLP